jgi:hypothetical protein
MKFSKHESGNSGNPAGRKVSRVPPRRCMLVHEEYAFGENCARPVLARLLDTLRPGDTLVVAQLDRLARSVSHLLAVIEQLEGQGAFPLPTRSDRHLNVAADVLSAGVGRGGPVRAGANCRTHQGRAEGGWRCRQRRRQSPPISPAWPQGTAGPRSSAARPRSAQRSTRMPVERP